MWMFYFLSSLVVTLGLLLKKYPRLYLVFIFVVFFLISGLRSPLVGNDTLNYVQLFDELRILPVSNFESRFEKGYLYFNLFLGYLFKNSQALLIISALIICSGYFFLITKYSKIPWMSVYLFLTLRFFDASMNVLRLSIAMSLIFVGVYCLLENKRICFFLFVILASLFHNTAIIFIVVYFLKYFKLNIKYLTITIMISFGITFFFDKLIFIVFQIFPAYTSYITSSYMGNEVKLATVLNLIINLIVFVWIFYMHKRSNDPTDEALIKIFFIGVCISVISFEFTLLDRVSELFTVFMIVLIPNSISLIKSSKMKIFISYAFIIFFFLYYLVIVIYRPEWNRIYPFTFFWQ